MRSALAAGLAATLVMVASAGSSLATSPAPANGPTWEPNQHVYYRWKSGSEPPGWMRAAINAAADDSNSSRASRAAILSQDADGASWISYSNDLPSDWAIGFTVRHVPEWFSIRMRPQGAVLDWGTMRWCQFYDTPPKGCYDAELIALHEFGHVQTLGHIVDADVTDWNDTVMHPASKTKAKIGWNMHEFGRCDVARLQIRYQPLRSVTPYSTCLHLDTALSLSSSAGGAPYGVSVTFTARLKVDPDVAYASLAGAEIDGRSVTLQRRVPGGSWSSVGDMTAVSDGTGRYQQSVSVTATYDWRAVFGTPTDEGLNGSSSDDVRVYLTTGCAPLSARHQSPTYLLC